MNEENKEITTDVTVNQPSSKTDVSVGVRGMMPKNFDETVRVAGMLFLSLIHI